tara:strand:+ start:4148 stop:5488 length:1341 start_codon:yes stop_codon:yes gene_type:complete
MLNGNINSVGKIADTSGDKINFDSNTLVIDETNNRVGIGVESPTESFEIRGSTSATRALVKTTTGNAIFRVDTDTSDFSVVGKGDSNRLDFYDANANATPFKLDGGGTGHVTDTLVVKSGKVGIGTSAPITALQVNSADHTQVQIRSSDGTKVPILSLTNTDRTWQLRCNGGSNDRFEIRDETASSDNTRFVINTSGEVGIGNAPSAKLHLEQGDFRINNDTDGFQVIEFSEAGILQSKFGFNCSNNTLNIRTRDSSGNLDNRVNVFSGVDNSLFQITNTGQSILSLKNSASNGADFRIISKVNGSKANLLFQDNTHSADIMTLTQDGQIGINTATPSTNLQINGTTAFQSAATTISGGAFAVTNSFHNLTPQGGSGSDDLDTINSGAVAGQILILRSVSSSNTITIKNGTGNIIVKGGDFVMNASTDYFCCIYDGSNWVELFKSE